MCNSILQRNYGMMGLLLLGVALLVQGCGGGDNPGTVSYTVNTSAGANGSISPASATVGEGETASFTVTPDTGYAIENVTGCDGIQEVNAYRTGPVTVDCTVTASFRLLQRPKLTALYTTNGVNWNDYIKNDGASPYTATDTATDGSETGGYHAVLHGGEMRVIELADRGGCTDITAQDDLGTFNWICLDTENPVRVVSTGLKIDKHLTDLISFTEAAWKPNRVTIYRKGAVYEQTPSSVWWGNPVIVDNDGSLGTDMSEGDIRIITTNPNAIYIIERNKVALVIDPVVLLSGTIDPEENLIEATSIRHLWIEGSLDVTDDNAGVSWDAVSFSVLGNIRVNNASGTGTGIELDNGSDNNIINHVIATGNAAGVSFWDASNNTLIHLTASKNGAGVELHNASTNNVLMQVTTSNNGEGVYISSALNNIIMGGATLNNYNGVSLSSASNNTLSRIVSSNNVVGVDVSHGSDNTFSYITASNNLYEGISLSFSSNNSFIGQLKVGNNESDCYINSGTDPGLDSLCNPQGSSDFILTPGISIAGAFVGKVMTDDINNTSDTNGSADFPGLPASFDWSNFENQFRTWGIDGPAFPSAEHRGQWTSGIGRIWDWSLQASDSVVRNIYTTLPTGDDTLTHVWSGTPLPTDDVGCDAMVKGSKWNGTDSVCETIFLEHAMEIVADRIGNDNGLCESDEACLFMPNMGSYQGHGNLIGAGAFIPGALTGVTLMKHEINGR